MTPQLIAASKLFDVEKQGVLPSRVILRMKLYDDPRPYMTHQVSFDRDTGKPRYYCGHYFASLDAAVKDFYERVRVCATSVEPPCNLPSITESFHGVYSS